MSARFKKLTKKERHIIYEAMELVAHDPFMGACDAIRCRDSKDTLQYAFIFTTCVYVEWLVEDYLAKGLTTKELQQWRLTMLAWFAEVGRLSDT